MADYQRIYDYNHIQSDCQEIGISSTPKAHNRAQDYYTFAFYKFTEVSGHILCPINFDSYHTKMWKYVHIDSDAISSNHCNATDLKNTCTIQSARVKHPTRRVIDNFGDESFQAINSTGADK